MKYRFAFMSFVFVALAAYALTPATQWGDVPPTNTLAEVAAGAGLATTTSVANAIATEASTRASQVAQAYANATNEAALSARDKYVPLDGSMQMLGPLQASQYVGFIHDGNYQTLYQNGSVLRRFWGRNFYFNFPSDFDTGIGNNTNSYFATRYWTYNLVTNDIASALADYAYNLYPVDVGGGTRRIEMPDAANTNNYVAFGWDVSISNDFTTAVGNMSKALGANSTTVGCNAEAQADNSTVLGAHATASGTQAVTIGQNSSVSGYAVAVGSMAKATGDGVSSGFQAEANAVGSSAVGSHAFVNFDAPHGLAFGADAKVYAERAVQIGAGNNTSNNSFKVFNRMLLDADGHVPLLTGESYDLSNAADVTRALGDIITALGGTVE